MRVTNIPILRGDELLTSAESPATGMKTWWCLRHKMVLPVLVLENGEYRWVCNRCFNTSIDIPNPHWHSVERSGR